MRQLKLHSAQVPSVLRLNSLSVDTLKINDSNDSHYLTIAVGSDLTADRTLTITPGDAARTITLSGNPTLADWFDQSVKQAASPTFASVIVTDDIYDTAWTDYSSTSTVVGWSSFTTKKIFYKKVGRLVFVAFTLTGTSNSTAVTFTLPFAVINEAGLRFGDALSLATDNGVTLTTPGRVTTQENDTTAFIYTEFANAAWTASGSKDVRGSFWYEAVS